MTCIHCHSTFNFIHSQLKFKQPLKTTKLFQFSNNEPPRLLQRSNMLSIAPLRTKAITSALVLGVSSKATPGDLSVLLQTGAVLLFVYWIGNFVVPEMILKDLQSDITSEDQKPKDEKPYEDEDESTPLSNTPSSGKKKKGFNSTKR